MSIMNDTEMYVLIFDPDPSDDFIIGRGNAIRELRSRLLKRRNLKDLILTVSGVCEAFCDPFSMPDTIVRDVQLAIERTEGTVLPGSRRLELGVCAVAAVIQSMASERPPVTADRWSVPDVIAGCAWSGLSFLPNCSAPKIEVLRRHAIHTARDRICTTGPAARVRHDVSSTNMFKGMSPSRNAYASAVRSIADLQINATLDREEIDVLRWVTNRVSVVHGKKLTSLSLESRVITSGLELGAITRVPPVQAHRNQLSCHSGQGDPLSLTELLERLGDDRIKIAQSLSGSSLLKKASVVFPLLSSICSGQASGPGSALRRPLEEWGVRALFEQSLVQTSV